MRIKLTGKHSAKVEEHKRETTPLECNMSQQSKEGWSEFLFVIVCHSGWEGIERVKDKVGQKKDKSWETWRIEDDKEKQDSLREARRQKWRGTEGGGSNEQHRRWFARLYKVDAWYFILSLHIRHVWASAPSSACSLHECQDAEWNSLQIKWDESRANLIQSITTQCSLLILHYTYILHL